MVDGSEPLEVKQSWDKSKCVFCSQSIEWGSGRYVNRIPASMYDEETDQNREGYTCAVCMTRECMICDEGIDLDQDVWIKNPDPKGYDLNIGNECCYDEDKHELVDEEDEG